MNWIADHAGLIGLLFFFSIFIGIAFWAYQPRRKQQLEALGQIPLNEDKHERA